MQTRNGQTPSTSLNNPDSTISPENQLPLFICPTCATPPPDHVPSQPKDTFWSEHLAVLNRMISRIDENLADLHMLSADLYRRSARKRLAEQQ